MKQNSIGRFIHILRTRNNISQQRLSKGLCSDATLSRIELGERVPDKFLTDALYQRLGKSPDKFEVFLSDKDYMLYEQRKAIEKALYRGYYAKAEELLEKYQKMKECKGNLHMQYLQKIQAILYYEEKKEVGLIVSSLKEALRYTLPGLEFPHIKNCLLSLEEVDILLLMVMAYSKDGEVHDSIYALKELLDYVESWYSDEEEKVKVYPKTAFLLAKLYLRQGEYKKAEDLCEKAIALLGSNGVIAGLSEVLNIYVETLEHNLKLDEAKKMRWHLNSLEEIYKEHEIEGQPTEMGIFYRNIQNEIYLMGELLKAERNKIKVSQENLSSDILSPESLSRIESGKTAPRNKNYEAIATRLGVSKDVYNSFLSAESYDILESKREIDRLLFRHQIEDAWINFMAVKKRLTDKTDGNRQYLLYMETLLMYQAKKISRKGALKQLKIALKYTRGDDKDITMAYSMLTRVESLILNQTAILLNETGNKEKAIQILKAILKSYDNSKIDIKYHSVQYLLVLQNLSMYLEEADFLEEAIETCDKAVALALECARGNFIARFLTNKAYTLERKDTREERNINEKTCRKYYRQAFSLSELMNDSSTHSIVGEYYKLKYNESVYTS